MLAQRAPQSSVDALPLYQSDPRGFSVAWSGSDPGSGIAIFCVQSKDGASGTWSDWQCPTAMGWWWRYQVQEGHTYYFRCRARDFAGNWEGWPADPNGDTHTTVDVTAPESSASSPDYDNWEEIAVSWTAVDATSGVASTKLWYKFGGGSWTDSGLSQGGTAGTFAFTPTHGDGTYYFATQSVDNAGNWEAGPTGNGDDHTVYDTASPTSEVADLPAYSPGTFAVSWSGTDVTSGVADYDVQSCWVDCQVPNMAVWSDWLTRTTHTSHAYNGNHGVTYYFRCRARDRAGNEEAYPLTADAFTLVDTHPPSTTVEPLPTYTYRSSFTVRWHGSDDLSGLQRYRIYYQDESAPEWTFWLNALPDQTSASFSGAQGHTYHFCSRGVDRAGNVEPCPSISSNWPIQSDAHTAVAPGSRVNDLPPYIYNTTFTVSWSGSTGVQGYDVQVRDGFYGAWQTWKSNVPYTSAQYTGQYGHIYCFRSRAR